MADIGNLGKYEIRREIGRGAMGVVYEGYDPLIKRLVALKTIRADQLAGDDAANVIARFRREAQAAGRLSHPNIVSIYDFGEDAGVWFIAMEYVRGRELKEYFEANERFSSADIVRIMSQILDALDYSHRQGVIHRDIKPANIFLLQDTTSGAAEGAVKVADFGIAHIESSNLTQVGAVLGTPSYMSPEQILGLPVDGRSDLFSAGVILYQFLTGERPFAGSATTTMQKVLKEDPLPPSSLNVQAPAAMDAIVRKALAKRPEDRFQTAREFADALRATAPSGAGVAAGATLLTTAPAVARLITGSGEQTIANVAPAAPSAAATLTQPSAPPLPPSAAPSRPAAAQQQSRAGIYILVGAVVAAIGAGALLLNQRSHDTPSAANPTARAAIATSTSSSVSAPSGAQTTPTSTTSATASEPPRSPSGTAPGTMTISAVGLVDPADPRYRNDNALLQSDLRADSKGQVVEKALGLMLASDSLAKNYDLIKDRLLSRSGDFIATVLSESEPRTGKDGLVSLTTEAVVNVRAVQKSLNEMSRDERVDLIRASGDPKVSVEITARDADQAGAPAPVSPVAENILKERIKSFGFRTWSANAPATEDGTRGADFSVVGEATIRKLSTRLEASGLTITKFALTSWTVKCVDRDTGEEIYYNTTLPKGAGSWATEEEALKAIGTRIADEFSRGFFLQHVTPAGQKVTLRFDGVPGSTLDALGRELVALPGLIAVTPRPAGVFELQVGRAGSAGDIVVDNVLKPLNAKLGQACFTPGKIAGGDVAVTFDPTCADPAILARMENNPPAALYAAPLGRQRAVVKNPETLRKLTI